MSQEAINPSIEELHQSMQAASLPLEEVHDSIGHLLTARALLWDVAAETESPQLHDIIETLGTGESHVKRVEMAMHDARTHTNEYLAEIGMAATVQKPAADNPDIPLRDKKKYLWNRFKEEHNELREVTRVIGEQAADHIALILRLSGPEGISAYTEGHTIVRLPSHDDQFTGLPPNIFGNLDDPDWKSHYPKDDAELEEMKRRYLENRPQGWMQNRPEGLPWGAWARPLEEVDKMFKTLVKMRDNGVELDADGWERYRQEAVKQMLTDEYNFDYVMLGRGEAVRNMRDTVANGSVMDDVGAERRDIMGVVHRTGHRHETMEGSLMPMDLVFFQVGEYGPEWTQRLVKSAIFAKEGVMFIRTQHDIVQMAAEHKEVIKTHTARGAVSTPETPPHETLGYTMEEAMVSIVQTLALFTAYKVPGYENDPEGLLKEIRDKGLVEEFTREVSAGIIGPTTLSGSVIPNILIKGEDGGLQLNPQVMAHLQAAKARQVAVIHKEWTEENVDKFQMMGLICPAAMPRGSLSKVNSTLIDVITASR